MSVRLCEGCQKPLGPMDGGYDVCMPCTVARQKAVTQWHGACHCGKQRRPSEIHKIGSRTWISCLRCLGQIKQLS